MKEFEIKKLYYSISEVETISGLEQHVLRYWETEFPQLNPSKNRSGNRIYTEKDIRILLAIKKLLREKNYTIEASRNYLKTKSIDDILNETDIESVDEAKQSELMKIRTELTELLEKVRTELPPFDLISN